MKEIKIDVTGKSAEEKEEMINKEVQKIVDIVYRDGKWFGYVMGLISGVLLSLLVN